MEPVFPFDVGEDGPRDSRPRVRGLREHGRHFGHPRRIEILGIAAQLRHTIVRFARQSVFESVKHRLGDVAGAVLRPAFSEPGRALARDWQNVAEIVATLIAGDNYVATFVDESESAIRSALERLRPDVLVAGPAFNAGRYGMGCGTACRVATRLGIPSVTAMFPANPALAMEQNRRLLVLPTAETALDMPRAANALARVALKLGRRETLGIAAEEGFLPRGLRGDVMHEDTGAERAIALLKLKLAGQPYRSELAIEVFDAVPPAPPRG